MKKISHQTNRKFTKNLSAFSLIELSIVLIILGLLTVSLTNGSNLIAKAKLIAARRATNSAPLISIPELTFWVESTSEKSFSKANPNDGEGITLWKDINPQNPNPLDLDSASVSPPIYKAQAINQLPAISFQYMVSHIQRSNVPAIQFSGANEITIFIVQRYIAGRSYVFNWRDSVSGHWISINAPWENGSIYSRFGLSTASNFNTVANIGLNQISNIPKILTFRKFPTSGEIFDAGKLISSSNTSNLSVPPDSIGNLPIGFFNGELGEVIVFSRALTDIERQSVEAYLSQKWKITLK